MGHRAGAGMGGLAGQVRRSYAESSAKVTVIGTIGERGSVAVMTAADLWLAQREPRVGGSNCKRGTKNSRGTGIGSKEAAGGYTT